MDNLKYYNDSFAYDYEIFAPSAPKKTAEIHEIPKSKKSASKSARVGKRVNALFTRNVVISIMVLAAVCGSLFLRAEISSLKAKINEENKIIAELESESTRLEVEIERKVSMTNLEEAALALGMQKCEKSQVTYIKTNQTDTIVNNGGNLTAEVE